MIFERIKSEGLAHNSYFIGSRSEAAVIDPRRDVCIYLQRCQELGMQVRYIFETHRNEDYLGGALQLNHETHAEIYHGPGLDWKFGTTIRDGQEFRIGKIALKAIHTPGHTDESTSYVLIDSASGDSPIMVFCGDSLFIGDTGRIDLYGPAQSQRLAASLHESIFEKLLPLGDGVILCPAHGAGSVCGMNIADRDESTIGIEKLQNPFLALKDKKSFVNRKVAEQPETPPYFARMEKNNQAGQPLLSCSSLPPPLTASRFKAEMEKGAVVVDTGYPVSFGGAHIKGAYSIWLEGLAEFAGWVLPYDKPILLVLEDRRRLEDAITYLIRLGYDNVIGYLKDGMEGWYNAGLPLENLPLLSVHQLKDKLDRGEELTVLDARGQSEWDSGHISGSRHIYVGHVEQQSQTLPRDRPVAAVCSVGHRAGLAASILLRSGFDRVYNVPGSVTAWRAAGYPLTKD
jgi:hydroxyacylglutathione hydrolase